MHFSRDRSSMHTFPLLGLNVASACWCVCCAVHYFCMSHTHSHIHLFPPASFLSMSRVPTGLNSGSRRHQNPLRITALRANVILCMLWHLFYDCLHIKYLNKQNGGLAAARRESHSFPCGGRWRAGRSWVCGGGRQNARHSEEKCSAWLQSKFPTTFFFNSHPAAVAAEPSVSDCAGPGGS